MLDRDQIAAASRALHGHWNAGTKLGHLDPSIRPRNRLEGYAIQAELEHTSLTKLFGWKIAATSDAGQKHINVAGPVAGRILAETVIADGGTASMAGNDMRVAEPEFAFRMGVDLPPRPQPFAVNEVLDAVDTCIRQSKFRIRDLPISSRPARHSSSPTMPARICLSWARRRTPTGARSI